MRWEAVVVMDLLVAYAADQMDQWEEVTAMEDRPGTIIQEAAMEVATVVAEVNRLVKIILAALMIVVVVPMTADGDPLRPGAAVGLAAVRVGMAADHHCLEVVLAMLAVGGLRHFIE